MLAVGADPKDIWQWPSETATRTWVVVAANAVLAAVVLATVKTWVAPVLQTLSKLPLLSLVKKAMIYPLIS